MKAIIETIKQLVMFFGGMTLGYVVITLIGAGVIKLAYNPGEHAPIWAASTVYGMLVVGMAALVGWMAYDIYTENKKKMESNNK